MFLVLISEKKSRAGMKSETQFSRKNPRVLVVLKFSLKLCHISGTGSIKLPIYMYIALSKVHFKKRLLWYQRHSPGLKIGKFLN